jgi:RND family efflux transporter MFP subunit
MARLQVLAVVGPTAALASSIAGCGQSQAQGDPRRDDPVIRLAQVQSASADERKFTGIVSARVQSNLGFRVSGKVIERLVDAGQEVRQGQVLMRLDRTDYAHAIANQIGLVEAARAHQQQAFADEARYRGLVASGAVSQSTYDQIKAVAASAQAILSAARAELKVAQDEGEYSTLVADADGTVVDTLVEPGQYVSAGQIVVRVARGGPREAAVNLPETLRPKMGSPAEAVLYGDSGKAVTRYAAHLRQLSDSADPLTRTFEARYVLDGQAAKAPLGATVTVYLDGDHTVHAMAVPLGALDDEGKGPGIWRFDEASSTVHYQPVTFVRFNGEDAVVSGAVHIGEPIVALGGHYLHEGQHVRLDATRIAKE